MFKKVSNFGTQICRSRPTSPPYGLFLSFSVPCWKKYIDEPEISDTLTTAIGNLSTTMIAEELIFDIINLPKFNPVDSFFLSSFQMFMSSRKNGSMISKKHSSITIKQASVNKINVCRRIISYLPLSEVAESFWIYNTVRESTLKTVCGTRCLFSQK